MAKFNKLVFETSLWDLKPTLKFILSPYSAQFETSLWDLKLCVSSPNYIPLISSKPPYGI